MADCTAKESISKNDPIIPLTGQDWEHVYEPAEDTYLFMDALQKELPDLQATRPAIIMEIGCGSGCISAYLAKNLHGPAYIATDINPHAIAAARRTFDANGLPIDLVHGNLCAPFRLNKRVDVLLFNPPYVPTPTEEIRSSWIARSWAGGIKGREVTDLLLDKLETYLSLTGRMYLVALDSNDPQEVCESACICARESERLHVCFRCAFVVGVQVLVT
jgi:release factor glutamine methyltransferase